MPKLLIIFGEGACAYGDTLNTAILISGQSVRMGTVSRSQSGSYGWATIAIEPTFSGYTATWYARTVEDVTGWTVDNYSKFQMNMSGMVYRHVAMG